MSEEEDDENTDAFNESDANLNEGEDSLASLLSLMQHLIGLIQ